MSRRLGTAEVETGPLETGAMEYDTSLSGSWLLKFFGVEIHATLLLGKNNSFADKNKNAYLC